MENLNLVELLRDCPTGMELDSTVFDNITFDYVNTQQNRVYCKVGKSESVWFTPKGGVNLLPDAKCVIFPKGKTTWDGFVPPHQFKDGDIITCTNSSCSFVAIFKKIIGEITFERYCLLILNDGKFKSNVDYSDFIKPHLATEEEKQKLFDAIKANGYKWNAETKTLEKLVKPKFKVGDRIKDKNNRIWFVVQVSDKHFSISLIPNAEGYFVPIEDQDQYELAPNKFDINTLKPFESKVLVRDDEKLFWRPAIFGLYKPEAYRDFPYIVVGGTFYTQCIPYEGNEHLLGTTNDCDDFYK